LKSGVSVTLIDVAKIGGLAEFEEHLKNTSPENFNASA
jgi:hypothetical protein